MLNMPSTVLDDTATSIGDELVCVSFVHGSDDAQACIQMLQDAGMTALLGEAIHCPTTKGSTVPVLVPASSQERAGEMLAAYEVTNSDWEDGEDDFDDDDDDMGDDDDDFYDDDDDDYDDDDDDDFEDFDDED